MSDIDSYARRSLVVGLGLLLLLFLGVGALSVGYGAELRGAAGWVNEKVGLPGLMLILFASDLLTSPVPPDAVLVVISQTPHHARWPWLVGIIGLLSVVAGTLGWALARRLGSERVERMMPRRFRRRAEPLVQRYGALAVAIGALTPVPFSFVCWAAGALKVPFAPFFASCWLRVPRFYLYYVAIAYADATLRIFFPG